MRKLQTSVSHEHRCKNLQQNASIIEIYTKSTRLISHLKINLYNSKQGQNKGTIESELLQKKDIDKIPHPYMTKKKKEKTLKIRNRKEYIKSDKGNLHLTSHLIETQ